MTPPRSPARRAWAGPREQMPGCTAVMTGPSPGGGRAGEVPQSQGPQGQGPRAQRSQGRETWPRAGQAPLPALPPGSRSPSLCCGSRTCQTGHGSRSRERGWVSVCARVCTCVHAPAPPACPEGFRLPNHHPASPPFPSPSPPGTANGPPADLVVTVGQAAALLVSFPNSICHGPHRKQMARTDHFLEGLWQRDC